jgi:hypothetical protein
VVFSIWHKLCSESVYILNIWRENCRSFCKNNGKNIAMKKNTLEKFYYANGKNSAVIRIYGERFSDKRKDERFRLPNSKIGGKASTPLGKERELSRKTCLADLSASGLQIITSDLLKPDEEYKINIYTPSFNGSLDLVGKVVWSRLIKKVVKTNYYRVGMKFINTNQEIKKKLQALELFCKKNIKTDRQLTNG